jgi:hypothetical protein
MAAVSLPGYPYSAPPAVARASKPRWWLIAGVTVWALLLTGFAGWSVRHDPATVPEQLDLAAALPVLQRTTGTVLAAADGPGRVVSLGETVFDRDCALTPVRDGVQASRDVTVRVPAGQAPAALAAIARALPPEYDAAARHNAAKTRFGLRADAGEFVGVEASAAAGDTVLTLRTSTGCRPDGAGAGEDRAPVPATATPAAFGAALAAVGAGGAHTVTGSEVACPNSGATARTVSAEGIAAPADLNRAVRDLVGAGDLVQAGPPVWAYRAGDVSVVIDERDSRVRVTATSACR